MISYQPLLVMLVSKKIKKTDLIDLLGLSSSTIAKFDAGAYVSLGVIDKLCQLLQCQPGDLIEYIEKPVE